MMEKSALASEGGGAQCTPTPFQPITITYKVKVYAPARRAGTIPLFRLYSTLYALVLSGCYFFHIHPFLQQKVTVMTT
jgi:hypothetical protein